MTRISLATLACLALAAGCSNKNTPESDAPGVTANAVVAVPQDGAATSPAASSGPRPKARSGTSTSGPADRVGKNRTLVAKKPPVKAGKKPSRKPKARPRSKASDPVAVAGVVPSQVAAGGLFQIYGEGFAEEPAGNKVWVGGTPQKVIAVAGDHIVVEAAGPVTGNVRVTTGTRVARGRARGKSGPGTPVTLNKITVAAPGGGFSAPATAPGQGLLGAVYDIGTASTGVPDFNSVGDPIAYVLVGGLDVGTGDFAGFDVAGKTLKDNFGIHFQGSLNVVEAGAYTLCLEAGDGAILFLNGEPLLDNDGEGATREVCDTVDIEPGEYDLQLLYYQNAGDLALRLTWAKDGGAKVVIPATAFFPPDNLDGLAAALNQ